MAEIFELTDEEMRKRIKEIDKQRQELSDEKRKYENHLNEQKLKKEQEEREMFIGKCFVTKSDKRNETKHIKAFKILKLDEMKPTRYAECIVLVDGYHMTAWEEKGVIKTTLGLWTSNTLRMISHPNDPKMIDMYEEVSQEEFSEMTRKYITEIQENI